MYALEQITPEQGTPPRLYRMRTMPPPVDQFALGQVDAITQDDVIREFVDRGYYQAAPAPAVVVAPGVTKADAIKAAVNQSIFAYELPHTAWLGVAEQYQCPQGDYGCPVPASWWPQMIEYTTMVANGILTGKYSMPDWSGVSLGAVSGGGLSGIGDWLAANPWIVSTVGAGISNYGAYLTAKNVEDELKKAIPSDLLRKEDLPALLAALQAGGAIPAGQAAVVAKGAEAATTPSWMMPALIAGGALVVFMLMKR